ncbi:hypothetical protein SDC9_132214 [bioreactor metagenome]|uniref:Uncharacterized protein n=1 Tax=bioreactor metagenome TaxID=1076179 RepID=A0A645D7H2_9ZZZZ
MRFAQSVGLVQPNIFVVFACVYGVVPVELFIMSSNNKVSFPLLAFDVECPNIKHPPDKIVTFAASLAVVIPATVVAFKVVSSTSYLLAPKVDTAG